MNHVDPDSKASEQQPPMQGAPDPAVRHRPLLIILFAAILLTIASVAKSQEPSQVPLVEPDAKLTQGKPQTMIQLNGVNHLVDAAAVDAGQINQVRFEQAEFRRQEMIEYGKLRPKYVELNAFLGNFDADAAPDGWCAQLILRDSHDRPVVMRAHARFELTTRIPLADFHDVVDSDSVPVRWSMNVQFDDDGVARFKLPLRQPLRPLFGWPTSVYPQSGLRSSVYGNYSPHRRSGADARRSTRLGRSLQSDWRNNLGKPHFGELRVRVSVPTEGVFEASAPVQIRPSVLVDTQWPYR